MGMLYSLSDHDVGHSARRRKSIESASGSDPGDFSRGGRGCLLSSSHGSCTLEAPSEELKEAGSVYTSTVEVRVNCGFNERTRVMQKNLWNYAMANTR